MQQLLAEVKVLFSPLCSQETPLLQHSTHEGLTKKPLLQNNFLIYAACQRGVWHVIYILLWLWGRVLCCKGKLSEQAVTCKDMPLRVYR